MTIILEDISKSYNGKRILDNLNVQIEDGKCYAFVGPKGCGKTTVLRIFMGLEKPDEGKVARMGDYKYPTLQTSYVSQNGSLNLKKNAIWNVKKAHRFASKGRAIEELSRFLPEDKMECATGELSFTQRKLVELVKALFLPSDFIVLDNLFEGMNDNLRNKVIDYLLEIKGSRPILISQESEEGLDFAKKIRL